MYSDDEVCVLCYQCMIMYALTCRMPARLRDIRTDAPVRVYVCLYVCLNAFASVRGYIYIYIYIYIYDIRYGRIYS
jgi:hypothetical protein